MVGRSADAVLQLLQRSGTHSAADRTAAVVAAVAGERC